MLGTDFDQWLLLQWGDTLLQTEAALDCTEVDISEGQRRSKEGDGARLGRVRA